MHKSLKSFCLLSLLALLNCSCHDQVDDCICKNNEVCVDAQCYLSESVHEIGGTTIIARNSFVGITNCNDCIDTLIFYNDTTRGLTDGRFGLVVADHQGGVENVAGSLPTMISDKEYYLYTSAPLCHLNGEVWYANLHFIIEPDSVWMNLKFWTLNSEPGVFVDSCNVMFYKKH